MMQVGSLQTWGERIAFAARLLHQQQRQERIARGLSEKEIAIAEWESTKRSHAELMAQFKKL